MVKVKKSLKRVGANRCNSICACIHMIATVITRNEEKLSISYEHLVAAELILLIMLIGI